MHIIFRFQQAWRAITTKQQPSDQSGLNELLTPSMLAVFDQLKPFEKAHSIQIYKRMVESGEKQSDLLVAALLHDVGKIRYPLRLWERVMIVAFKFFFPTASRNWGKGDPSGWRRPFVVAENHPAWGSKIALEAGASPLTAAIIERHQNPIIPPITGTTCPAGDLDRVREVDYLVFKLQLLDDRN